MDTRGPRASPVSLQARQSVSSVGYFYFFPRRTVVLGTTRGPRATLGANVSRRRPRRLPHRQQRALWRRAVPPRIPRPGWVGIPSRHQAPEACPDHVVSVRGIRSLHVWGCSPSFFLREGTKGGSWERRSLEGSQKRQNNFIMYKKYAFWASYSLVIHDRGMLAVSSNGRACQSL